MCRQPSPALKKLDASDKLACHLLGYLIRDTQASYETIALPCQNCKVTIAYLEVSQALAGLAQVLHLPRTGWKCPKLLQS